MKIEASLNGDSSTATEGKRVAILIVAYNAANTLRSVLDRIPAAVWDKVAEVCVFDDSSHDDTYLVGVGYKTFHGNAKLSVFRNEKNLGYGGNQIRGYQYVIEQGHDIVVLLHGDGQYAPEVMPELLAPLERGEADAVFGSRMMTPGRARQGGMPVYKYLGNRVLSGFQNAALGMNLSEFHSGYRAYSTRALRNVPFDRNTHDFHFDTQIILQLLAAGKRIVEVPIPTYYGSEICHVNGIKYAWNVARSVLDFQLQEMGLTRRPEYEVTPTYRMKQSRLSSHMQVLEMVGTERRRVLELGCGSGELGRALRARGHEVVGVDATEPTFELDEFIQADLTQELPLDPARCFDVVILADVLEHVVSPETLLRRGATRVQPGGRLLVSLPNAVHWSVRVQVAGGRFEYTNRGLLDRGHVRFFTRASAERLFADAGLEVIERRHTPIPWENVLASAFLTRQIEKTDYFLGGMSPGFFAYQHLFELRPSR